jgi:hypothetical protein
MEGSEKRKRAEDKGLKLVKSKTLQGAREGGGIS